MALISPRLLPSALFITSAFFFASTPAFAQDENLDIFFEGNPEFAEEEDEFSTSSVVAKDKLWENGQTLRIRFLSGTQDEVNAVARYASEWTQHANLTFEYVNSGPTDIRINIDSTRKHWSYIGTDADTVVDSDATMNLGLRGQDPNSTNFQTIVLHEFGHAIGLIHEHQNPNAGICWDRPRTYAFYQSEVNWNESKVNQNIFKRYGSDSTNATEYDPLSIMHYEIDRSLLTCDQAVARNTQLSQVDKDAIAQTYPGATTSTGGNTGTGGGTGSIFVEPAASDSGGGCQYIMGSASGFDPTLPFSLIFSLIYVFRKRLLRIVRF